MTTTTRRAALQGAAAAFAETVAASTVANASSDADAGLLAAVERWKAVEAQLEALFNIRTTIEMERKTEDAVEALQDRQLEVADTIMDRLPPQTIEGARIIADLALRQADLRDGWIGACPEVVAPMAFSALAFITHHKGCGGYC